MTDDPSPPRTRSDQESATDDGGHAAHGTGATDRPAIVEFDQIANGANSLLIRLGTEVYTLRRTHSGKLILNK